MMDRESRCTMYLTGNCVENAPIVVEVGLGESRMWCYPSILIETAFVRWFRWLLSLTVVTSRKTGLSPLGIR